MASQGHTDLTHFRLVMPYIWINIGSGNGLLPNGTKPFPDPILNSRQWGYVGQFHRTCLRYQSIGRYTLLNLLPGTKVFRSYPFLVGWHPLATRWWRSRSNWTTHGWMCMPTGLVLQDQPNGQHQPPRKNVIKPQRIRDIVVHSSLSEGFAQTNDQSKRPKTFHSSSQLTQRTSTLGSYGGTLYWLRECLRFSVCYASSNSQLQGGGWP